MRKSKKVVVLVVAILVFSLALGAVTFANDNFKSLKAWFGKIDIYRNGSQVEFSHKPFIVEGTTYVPLRDMSELLGKDVGWDGDKYRIDIDDKPAVPDPEFVKVSQQLIAEQIKVVGLEARIKELEAKLEAKEEELKKDNIEQLEYDLNRWHGTYERIKFDINLSKSKDNIDVDIYVDLYDYSSRWNSLYTSDVKKYIQGIVDDIVSEYKNASISGSIRDSSTSRNNKIGSFYTRANGSLYVETNHKTSSGKYDYDLGDLQRDLNNNNYRIYDSHDRKYVYFDISLYGDEDEIRVDIVSEDYYDDELYYLDRDDIRDYLKDIYYEITRDFPYADVYGYIEDYETEYYFEFDYRGDLYLSR